MRYPLSFKEVLDRKDKLLYPVDYNSETEDYLTNRPFEISESIHICICGDSNVDVYTKNFYRTISQFAIRPFLHYFKLPHTRNKVAILNVGSKFNFDLAWKYMYSK